MTLADMTATVGTITMSFCCPHFDIERDYCLLLEADCVAGQPGCVLRKTSVFYIPAEERLEAKEIEAASRGPGPAVGQRHPERRASSNSLGL